LVIEVFFEKSFLDRHVIALHDMSDQFSDKRVLLPVVRYEGWQGFLQQLPVGGDDVTDVGQQSAWIGRALQQPNAKTIFNAELASAKRTKSWVIKLAIVEHEILE
jgi:hypothetical protein